MGLFSRKEPDPIAQEIKALKREQRELQTDVMFGQSKPGDAKWEEASARSKEIHREVRRLERGR